MNDSCCKGCGVTLKICKMTFVVMNAGEAQENLFDKNIIVENLVT
jgi:hypothetical protein